MNDSINYINTCEKKLKKQFEKIDYICFENSKKVLNSFRNNKVSTTDFNSTTGYGYGDVGRETIEKVFSEIFNTEDSLVRNQLISGSHALCVTLFGLLRPNDTLLSISGLPYDTLHEVIGIRENNSSLKSFGVNYEQIDLIDNDFNYNEIEKKLKENKIKLIEIQRSKGYSTRKSIDIKKIKYVISFIRKIDKDVIIMIDNCYCEFVTTEEPSEADIIVGSLIKNLGGGISPNGAYITGKKKYINLIAERLTLPGEGKEVGPTLGINKYILQGLFMAPSVVASSLKTATLASYVLSDMGYKVEPSFDANRADIVQNVVFEDKEKLISFCKSIQEYSPIDSHLTPIPSDMPGYDDQVIMACGAFTQGSSIELSCDGPLRFPYIAYLQGGLTYEYGKLAIANAINNLKNN